MAEELKPEHKQVKTRPDYLIETLNANMGYFFRSGSRLAQVRTEYQDLEIHDLPNYGKILRLDGVFQTSDRDEFLYHEPLAHIPGMAMDGPRRGLVIGGGDGGAAEEILKYPTIDKVVMVELDKGVCDASVEHLPSIGKAAFDNPKFEVRIEDGLKYIENYNGEPFDHILIDLTDPFGPSVALYTVNFYKRVSEILSERGILSLHIESPITRPQVYSRLFATLSSVFRHVKPFTQYVPLYGTLWGFAIASNSVDPTSIPREEIEARIKKFNLPHLQWYNADVHYGVFALPNWIRDLLSKPAEVVTLENPVVVEGEIIRNLRMYEE